MHEKTRQIIHLMDQRTDKIQDDLLLKMAAGIRDGLMGMPDDQAEEMTDSEWEKNCEKLICQASEACSDREKIRMFLTLTGDCGSFAPKKKKSGNPEELHRICEVQRDRIRFFRIMKPLRNEIIESLPETERAEERSIAKAQEQIMAERLNAYLILYRFVSAEHQNCLRLKQLHQLEKKNTTAEEQRNNEEQLIRISAYLDCLEEAENKLKIFPDIRRRIAEPEGYELYRKAERGKESNADQRDPAEAEKPGDPERNPEKNALQPSPAQYGKQREKNAEGCAVHETEGD